MDIPLVDVTLVDLRAQKRAQERARQDLQKTSVWNPAGSKLKCLHICRHWQWQGPKTRA